MVVVARIVDKHVLAAFRLPAVAMFRRTQQQQAAALRAHQQAQLAQQVLYPQPMFAPGLMQAQLYPYSNESALMFPQMGAPCVLHMFGLIVLCLVFQCLPIFASEACVLVF